MAGGPEQSGQESLGQERREWVIQRVAWAVMTLVVLAALLGVFGNGPLSRRTAESDPPGLRMDYQRIVRFQAPMELRLRIDAPARDVTVTFGEGYFEHLDLESVVPEPREQRSGDGRLAFVIQPARAGEAVEVTVRAKVQKPGRVRGTVSVDGAGDVPRRISFEQFALP